MLKPKTNYEWHGWRRNDQLKLLPRKCWSNYHSNQFLVLHEFSGYSAKKSPNIMPYSTENYN